MQVWQHNTAKNHYQRVRPFMFNRKPICTPEEREALKNDGSLVDDFLIVPGENSIHVCNAPSPAATSSLEIGKAIVSQIPEQAHLKSLVA